MEIVSYLLATKTSIGIGIANNSTVSNTCKLIKMIGGSKHSYHMPYSTNFWQRKNLGKFGESLVVCQILPSTNLTISCDIKESKQTGIHQSVPPSKIYTIQYIA